MPTTTLLTGGNGFAGANFIDLLLSPTYNHDKIILALRRASALDELTASNPSWPKDRLVPHIIPDISAPGAYDSVFQKHPDIDYVIHLAAPLGPKTGDFAEDFQKPNEAGSRELLTSAKKYGKSVKAISVTGSINAMTTGAQFDVKSREFDNNSWLPYTVQDAIEQKNPFISYCVGKKIGEQAIWKFVEEEKPHFSVTNFCPPLLWGPLLQHVPDTKHIGLSAGLVYSIMKSAESEDGKVPATLFPAWIDVRDLAHLEILALTNPRAANKRFLVGAPLLFNDVAATLRSLPNKTLSARVGADNDEPQTWVLPRMHTEEVEEVFGSQGFKMRPLEETLRDTAVSLLGVEEREKGGVSSDGA